MTVLLRLIARSNQSLTSYANPFVPLRAIDTTPREAQSVGKSSSPVGTLVVKLM